MGNVPKNLVALAYVANVRASADFYQRLGRLEDPDGYVLMLTHT